MSLAPSAPAASGQEKQAALPRELSELLIELSIGVHRFAMYPPGHPSLSIGVAHRQLIIEGVATDSRPPVLSDLARRLHGHQLGTLSFAKGTNAREVEGMLTLLGRASERGGEPAGLLPRDQIPSWEFARVHPVGYDQLEMKGERGEEPEQLDRAAQLWL